MRLLDINKNEKNNKIGIKQYEKNIIIIDTFPSQYGKCWG